MPAAADKQRTIVIGLTLIFVLLIVAVSIWGPGDDEAGNSAGGSTATTVPFGPLGNGVATCERRSADNDRASNFVVVYSIEEATPRTYRFRVSLTAQDGSQHDAVAEVSNVTSARLSELALVPDDLSLSFVDCRITGIQQDKRVLIANN